MALSPKVTPLGRTIALLLKAVAHSPGSRPRQTPATAGPAGGAAGGAEHATPHTAAMTRASALPDVARATENDLHRVHVNPRVPRHRTPDRGRRIGVPDLARAGVIPTDFDPMPDLLVDRVAHQ